MKDENLILDFPSTCISCLTVWEIFHVQSLARVLRVDGQSSSENLHYSFPIFVSTTSPFVIRQLRFSLNLGVIYYLEYLTLGELPLDVSVLFHPIKRAAKNTDQHVEQQNT